MTNFHPAPNGTQPNPARLAISYARFYLHRAEDVSGVSGTGIVAEGIQFSSGKVVVSWTRPPFSIGFYADLQSVIDIHGHAGTTEVQWLD